jgi:hypothetical protein
MNLFDRISVLTAFVDSKLVSASSTVSGADSPLRLPALASVRVQCGVAALWTSGLRSP